MVENTAKGYGATGKVTYTDGYTKAKGITIISSKSEEKKKEL